MERIEKYFKIEVTSTHFEKVQSYDTELSESSSHIAIDFFPPLIEPINLKLSHHSLEISGDRMGITPVYVQILEDRIVCSSHVSKLTKSASRGLCLDPIKEFTNTGIILGDQTIWKGIFKVNPKFQYIINLKTKPFSLIRRPVETLRSKQRADKSLLLDQIKKSLDKIIEKSNSGLFALSGGADTRLLLAMMDESDRKNITFYTKAHPNIGSGRDKDLEIARKLAKSYGLKHRVVEKPEIYLAFLIPEFTKGKPISGLYGGEILGLIRPSAVGIRFNEDQCSKEWVKALLNTSRSIVYNQIDYGWATPHTLLYFTDTPFIDPVFIDLIFGIEEDEKHEYKLYANLWDQEPLQQFLNIPFSSPITSASKRFQWIDGPEPKLIPSPYRLKTNLESEFNEDLNKLSKNLPNLKDQKLKNLQFYVTQTGVEDPYGLI